MTNTNTRQPAADDAATPEAARPSEPTPNTRPTGEGSPPAPPGAGSDGSARRPLVRCDLSVRPAGPAEFALSAVVTPEGAAVAVITGISSPMLADAAIAILREMADKLEAGA